MCEIGAAMQSKSDRGGKGERGGGEGEREWGREKRLRYTTIVVQNPRDSRSSNMYYGSLGKVYKVSNIHKDQNQDKYYYKEKKKDILGTITIICPTIHKSVSIS
jgi:hypothetical protein